MAKVVIDATDNDTVITMLGLKIPEPVDFSISANAVWYRTSIAAGIGFYGEINSDKPAVWSVPMSAVIVNGADNLLHTTFLAVGSNMLKFWPFYIEVGRGAGALAAYCAFYKTTAKKMRVRFVQSELMNFKADLLPFTDVEQGDPNWRSIQQIAATGLLKGVATGAQFLFGTDSLVSTAEVKPVLTEIYTRAFYGSTEKIPARNLRLETCCLLLVTIH